MQNVGSIVTKTATHNGLRIHNSLRFFLDDANLSFFHEQKAPKKEKKKGELNFKSA